MAQQSSGDTFEVMNGNDYIRVEDILAQLATKGLDRISEVRADLAIIPDARWIMDSRVLIAECKRWPAASGSVVLPAMTVGGTTTVFPELPADHLVEARKRVISRQLFLIVLITLIVFAAPALVLNSDLPSGLQLAIVTYDGIVAAYAAAYTFSALDKRK